MNFKEFMNLLIDDKLKGVYLFDSKEEFLNDTIIEEVRNKVNIPDFNLVEIKGNTNIETIKNSYETYPVMDEKKYIIWRNIDISKKSIKEYENTLNILADDFKEFPEFALLLIFSDNPPFKGKFYKSVAKNGKIVEINRLNQKELESFIGKRFVRNGKKIQKFLVREIVSRFSYLSKDSEIDLYEIVNVVDKIIASSSN
ncbi:MAG: DNA polymerase III subunit delta, partial [Anaerococcus sp.]|nr:DNA polymerase III subunit delta [Anaerococcus sp.]